MIADEVQTGFGRTGYLMAYMHDLVDLKPDMICVGKSVSGGVTPVSGVLASDLVMSQVKAGEAGNTYGGNPLGMACAKAAVKCLIEEGMVENSRKMGEVFVT